MVNYTIGLQPQQSSRKIYLTLFMSHKLLIVRLHSYHLFRYYHKPLSECHCTQKFLITDIDIIFITTTLSSVTFQSSIDRLLGKDEKTLSRWGPPLQSVCGYKSISISDRIGLMVHQAGTPPAAQIYLLTFHVVTRLRLQKKVICLRNEHRFSVIVKILSAFEAKFLCGRYIIAGG